MRWGKGLVGVTVVVASGLAACGGSSGSASTDPAALLRDAKATIDRTQSVHFDLTSSGVTGSGTVISGGSGDIARPDRLAGSFTVLQSGFSVSVGVLAGGGKFLVKLPFQSSYSPTDPSTYGVGNPAQLLDPTHGLSSLLAAVAGPHLTGQTRIGADVVDQVAGTVPGDAVPVIPDANRTVPVAVVASVTTGSHQLRRITLQGPFTSTAPSTYTVALTGYGAPVTITLPGG